MAAVRAARKDGQQGKNVGGPRGFAGGQRAACRRLGGASREGPQQRPPPIAVPETPQLLALHPGPRRLPRAAASRRGRISCEARVWR
eukprot:10592618-Lingulodinium_polyedra.AAC.2